MNLVYLKNGALDLNWTWFPWWLVQSPAMTREIMVTVRDAVLLNGVPADDSSLAALDDFVIRIITKRFKIPGLDQYLRAMKKVEPALA